MDVSVIISWKTVCDHVGWSAGHCPHCQQLEAVRIENLVQVVSIFFIPAARQILGQAGRCDFCERWIEKGISSTTVPVPEWSPSIGLEVLVAKLALPGDIRLPENSPDTRLHSLLAAAKEVSSIDQVDITFGITTGVILGIALGIPVGFYLFDGIIKAELAILVAGVIGAIVGATVDAIRKRGPVAFQKIDSACERYRLDTVKLEQLSQAHGGRVQRAVRAVRDTTRQAQ